MKFYSFLVFCWINTKKYKKRKQMRCVIFCSRFCTLSLFFFFFFTLFLYLCYCSLFKKLFFFLFDSFCLFFLFLSWTCSIRSKNLILSHHKRHYFNTLSLNNTRNKCSQRTIELNTILCVVHLIRSRANEHKNVLTTYFSDLCVTFLFYFLIFSVKLMIIIRNIFDYKR